MSQNDENTYVVDIHENPKIISDKIKEKDLSMRIKELAIPSLAEHLLGNLFGMVDMIMVGKINTQSLVAVGLTNQPMKLALAVFQALNVGSMALVARFIGTDDNESASAVVKQTLNITVIMGILTSVCGYFLAGKVISFMGAKPDVFPLAVQYLRIISLGGICITTSMGISAILQGAGDTITPMRYNLVSNLVNVVLNYFLIYGNLGFPAMGIAGAAIATTISRLVGMIMALSAIYRHNFFLCRSERKGVFFDYDIIQRILKIGIPSGMEQIVLRTGMIEFVRAIAGLGTTIYAAHQVSMDVLSLSFSPSMAFRIAATTLVGQSLGAGKPDLAEKSGIEARRMGMIVAVMIASTFFLFGRCISGVYTDDPEVISLAAGCLKIAALMQPMQSTQFILAGALRGAGDTWGPLLSSLIGIWGIRVILTKIFIKIGFGLTGAWMALACDQLLRSVYIYLRYKSGNWKKLKV